jgi:hypothetical protein
MGEYIMKVYAMEVTHDMLVGLSNGSRVMPKRVSLHVIEDGDMMLNGTKMALTVKTPIGDQVAKVGDWLLEVNDEVIGVCAGETFEGLFTPIGAEVDQYVLGIKLTARENEIMALRGLLRAAYRELDTMKGKALDKSVVEGIVDGLQSS